MAETTKLFIIISIVFILFIGAILSIIIWR